MTFSDTTSFYTSPHFQSFFEKAAQSLVFAANSPVFTILAVSDTFLKLVNRERSELLGKGLFEVFPGDSAEPSQKKQVLDVLRGVIETGKEDIQPNLTYRVFLSDLGQERTFHWKIINQPAFDSDGNVVCIINTTLNITDTVRQQDALASAYEEIDNTRTALNVALDRAEAEKVNLENLFMEAPAGIVVFDGPEFVFQLVNPVYEAFFPGRQLVGKPLLEALPEITGHPLIEGFKDAYHKGETYYGNEVETQLLRKAGSELQTSFWNFIVQPRYGSNGNIDGVLLFGFEVTEQVLLRRSVEESELRLSTILETMAEGVGITDVRGNLVYANRMAQNILGLKKDEILERTYHDQRWQNLRLDGSPLPEEEHPMYLALTTGKPVFDCEIAVQPPDGERFYISINAAPILDEQGKITGGIGTFMDVTQRRKSLQLKDEFISTVSHELKTPVTSIKAYSQLLHRTLPGSENSRNREFLNRMDMQIKHLESLIRDLLDITRIDSGKLDLRAKKFRMDVALSELVSDLQLITPGHKLIITQNQPITVIADESRILQVLTNLITNAVKYSPQADQVLISLASKEDKVIVSVQDFGIGIAENQKEQIFERFHQAGNNNERSGLSLGLGLYISKEIVRKAGGEIWFETEFGKGSTFYFSLPRS